MAVTGEDGDYGLADQTKSERRRVPKGRVRVGMLEGWDWSCMEGTAERGRCLSAVGNFTPLLAFRLPCFLVYIMYARVRAHHSQRSRR